MSEDKRVHAGHRERLRIRLMQEGLQGFQPHEVLELLLCFAIPQRDVNPLAHALLSTFGSLSGVLEASPQELAKCPGVGAHATALLTLIPQLTGYYMRDRLRDRPVLRKANDAGAFCQTLFFGMTHEAVYMICMDARARVIHPALVQTGTIDESPVYARDLVAAALRHNAHAVVLAHNHPGGSEQPSSADYEVTQMAIRALDVVNIRVVDHIIVGEGGFTSMAQAGMLAGGAPPKAEPEHKVRETAMPVKRRAGQGTAGEEAYAEFAGCEACAKSKD